MTPTAGALGRSTSIAAGSRRSSRASAVMAGGSVAEKSSVCRRVAGSAREDPPDVGQESHVEHPVGLVEDQHLEAAEPRVRMLEVIQQPAGRGDEDVDAAPERRLLRTHADAAEDGGAADAREARELVPVLVDLRGQLARGREDERARDAARLGRSAAGGSAAGTRPSCRCRSWRRRARRGPRTPAGWRLVWIGVGTVKPRASTARSRSG